jgi:adenylate kinase
MHKILMLGPQGSGKGTQAKILAQWLQVPHLSMGELLRAAALQDDDRARVIRPIVTTGELVPFSVALSVLVDRLAEGDAQNGYLLDGFPRNEDQFLHFDAYDQPTHVIVLTVPYEVSLDRLTRRAQLEGRVDDTQEVIARRLQIYANETDPMIDHYRERGIVHEIDAVGSVEEVAQRVAAVFGSR